MALQTVGCYPCDSNPLSCRTINACFDLLQVISQMSQVINHEFAECNRGVPIQNPYVVNASFVYGPDDS